MDSYLHPPRFLLSDRVFRHMVTLYVMNSVGGKLLLNVMHYNIALLPKKGTNYLTLVFKYELGLIVCF